MRRFWIELENEPISGWGYGVTALNLDDALSLLEQHVFKGGLPKILKLAEDVDVSSVDRLHVVPNMGNVLVRGIWYPVGFTRQDYSNW